MPAFSFTLQLSLIDVPRIYNSLDFTQKDINSIERSYRYKSAKFFDTDYNKNTREKYKFKVIIFN